MKILIITLSLILNLSYAAAKVIPEGTDFVSMPQELLYSPTYGLSIDQDIKILELKTEFAKELNKTTSITDKFKLQKNYQSKIEDLQKDFYEANAEKAIIEGRKPVDLAMYGSKIKGPATSAVPDANAPTLPKGTDYVDFSQQLLNRPIYGLSTEQDIKILELKTEFAKELNKTTSITDKFKLQKNYQSKIEDLQKDFYEANAEKAIIEGREPVDLTMYGSMKGPTISQSHFCEEITEQFVICNGARYVFDSKSTNELKREMKKIEKSIDPSKLESSTNAVSK